MYSPVIPLQYKFVILTLYRITVEMLARNFASAGSSGSGYYIPKVVENNVARAFHIKIMDIILSS